MELDPSWFDTGLWGLFLATLLAATVLPFSSEAIFLFYLTLGYDQAQVVLIASLGNWSGGMLSFTMGWFLPVERASTYFRVDPVKLENWVGRIRSSRAAIWGLLCWLPVVGDLIALALGSLRASPLLTAAFILIGKASRYVVVAWIWSAI